MAILIKRYANRKLYNTESSRYITLKGVAKLLDEGEEVRVIDNQTGEDITQVALSQILVDNQRAKESPSDTLLSQLLERGGDALYGAIRKSVDDASDGLGEFQDRFRRIVSQSEELARSAREATGFNRAETAEGESGEHRRGPFAASSRSWTGGERRDRDRRRPQPPSDDLDRIVQESITRALEGLDLPQRSELVALDRNLERLGRAVERLEERLRADETHTTNDDAEEAAEPVTSGPTDGGNR